MPHATPSKVLIGYHIKDISCPATGQIYFDPVVLGPCAHIIEAGALEGLAACPACESEIVLKSTRSPSVLVAQIENALAAHPELAGKRYFSIDAFYTCLSEQSYDSPTWHSLMQVLIHDPPRCSLSFSGSKVKHQTPSDLLLNSPDINTFLQQYPALKDIIQVSPVSMCLE